MKGRKQPILLKDLGGSYVGKGLKQPGTSGETSQGPLTQARSLDLAGHQGGAKKWDTGLSATDRIGSKERDQGMLPSVLT